MDGQGAFCERSSSSPRRPAKQAYRQYIEAVAVLESSPRCTATKIICALLLRRSVAKLQLAEKVKSGTTAPNTKNSDCPRRLIGEIAANS